MISAAESSLPAFLRDASNAKGTGFSVCVRTGLGANLLTCYVAKRR